MLANGDKTRPCGHILCTRCFRADRVSGQGTAIGRVCLSVRQPVSTPAVDATANLCANLIYTYAKSVPLTRINLSWQNTRHLPLMGIHSNWSEGARRRDLNWCTDGREYGTDDHALRSRIHDVQVVSQPVHGHWINERQACNNKDELKIHRSLYLFIQT